MRVFAVSDIHVDYPENARWVRELSHADFTGDVLILAGDVTSSLSLLEWTLGEFARRFQRVLYVPGNHELWIQGREDAHSSFEKFDRVLHTARQSGVVTERFQCGDVCLVPLLGWYDESFGTPSEKLREIWMDFRVCAWPAGYESKDVARHFTSMNESRLERSATPVISCSHFVPRIDVMPASVSEFGRQLFPVLGSRLIEEQIRRVGAGVHVYGHSHINRRVTLDGVRYINNAFGYPHESCTTRQLVSVYET